MLILAAAVLSAFPAPAVANETSTPVAVEQTSAWAQAEANREKIKSAPSFIDGPSAELPEAEKTQGHHGLVVVQGIIGIDGKMTEIRVKVPSGASTVDDIAVAAARASTFVPAKDASGDSLPLVSVMPFDLVAYKAAGGMGILQYKCAQFVRDMDWWKSVNPDKSFKKHELYTMEIGFAMSAMIQQSQGNQELLSKAISGFEDRWIAAIELCRKKPNMLQRDAIYR